MGYMYFSKKGIITKRGLSMGVRKSNGYLLSEHRKRAISVHRSPVRLTQANKTFLRSLGLQVLQ